MLIVTGGLIKNNRITTQIYRSIEHGQMPSVSGIVLHQTSSNYTAKTLAAYAFRPSGTGTHFLINPAGQIFQTARINQICWHIGRIRSHCMQMHQCNPSDKAQLDELKSKYTDKDEYDRQVDAHERKKAAKDRYPTNVDSIGIEVVGAPVNRSYRQPTPAQNSSSKWLTEELLLTLNLTRDRIYPHGLIDPRKQESEGRLIQY
ncbi:peptidoglycan recognition protein family protein [Acidovorax sp. NCPPB 4044]|uniref:peptidoglycan recognition protein family protein n=1 Tax=Acidovorax sp. NCPPB 4044 TaxID=2940490 RepID=UPI0023023115|nr:N-acetylmuramoyl-L-alanine amidase [Acidovorax sp. NCPPB 4044]MDA8521567.1 N-acetylmuramoyl-L-alanine amidase [Acidovorax sp. NCPPB 4044]